jgi:hypothetical protein
VRPVCVISTLSVAGSVAPELLVASRVMLDRLGFGRSGTPCTENEMLLKLASLSVVRPICPVLLDNVLPGTSTALSKIYVCKIGAAVAGIARAIKPVTAGAISEVYLVAFPITRLLRNREIGIDGREARPVPVYK